MYQFIKSRIVVVADHFGLPFGALLWVRPQVHHHVCVRICSV